MQLPTDPIDWVTFLSRMHDRDLPRLKEYDALYRGTAPMNYLHPEVVAEVGDRIKPIMLGWPMLAVDPLEERLDVLGFRYPEDQDDDPNASPDEVAAAAGDRGLQRIWDDNDLDAESSLGHTDALVMERAYIQVGTRPEDDNDTDSPLITVESPLEMFAYIDPGTRRTMAALRRWTEIDPLDGVTTWRYGTLYLPGGRYHYEWGGGPGVTPGWIEQEGTRDEHKLGDCCVIPLTNRARLSDRYGSSELTPQLLSLSHDANVLASLMMVGAEFHAIPLRALFGIGPDDLIDEAGNKLTALQVILGRLLTLPTDSADDIKAHEFTASSLANFHDSMNQLARHAAGLIGLPPDALGLTTDQPPSAESRRAGEVRQIKRAERKQRSFNGWAKAMRIARRIQDGDWDPKARRLVTIWRDAGTPTRAQAVDAATKAITAGIATTRQAREDVGYSPDQIRRMEAEDAVAAERGQTGLENIANALTQHGQPVAPQVPVTAGEPV